MKKITLAVIAYFLLGMPFTDQAHPGHGITDGYTITHYFTEPVHLMSTAVVLFVLVVYYRHLRRNKQTK